MNRSNLWIHIGLAVVLVTLAAVVGQIERWKSALKTSPVQIERVDPARAGKTRGLAGTPEVLVRFKPGTGLEAIRAIASSRHDVVTDEIEAVSGLVEINDLEDASPEKVAAEYAALESVEYAEPNYRINLDDPASEPKRMDLVERVGSAATPNDPLFGDQWALNNSGQDGGKARADLGALVAWEKTRGNSDVVIAVLDTGVDYTHVDLRENMWIRPANLAAYTDDELGTYNDLNGFNGTDQAADPMDDNGHGTHCAGIIGAEGNNGEGITGINWKVKIMPLKFLGRGGFGNTDDAIEAINYAIDRKKKGVNIRVISASWGSTQRSKALEDTIRAAGEAGILFVAAAGNDGSNNDSRPHYPSNYKLPNVISVAALDRNDKLASFSNYGAETVHVAAPGKDILSTWLGEGYREASGTSMATPYVSGIAALVVAAEPAITLEELRARIIGSVDKLDSLSGKVASGGRICAEKAVGQ
jgi:subtilisin family serine protease